jgi:hypothetical protein
MKNASHEVAQPSLPPIGVVFNDMNHTVNSVPNMGDVEYPAFAAQPITPAVVENTEAPVSLEEALVTKEPVSLAQALEILDAANAEHEQNAAALLAELNVLMAESKTVVANCIPTESN